jgi:WD repeat-containing protein 48
MEEIKRDEAFRRSPRSNGLSNGLQRKNQPKSIALPIPQPQSSNLSPASASALTPRQTNGAMPMTPGFSIGIASPSLPPSSTQSGGHLTPTAEEESSVDKRPSQQDQTDPSNDKAGDYFSSNLNSHQSEASSVSNKAAITPSEGPPGTTPASTTDDREEKKKSSLFGKKFQMTFPKNMKLGRNSTDAKAAVGAEEKQEEVSDKSSELEEKVFEDNLFGVIQRIRHEYEEQSRKDADHLVIAGITPSLPNETPVSNPPPDTMIIIQEDNPESGGVADLYRGAIGTLAKDADVVEKVAPTWLGELLLKVGVKSRSKLSRES